MKLVIVESPAKCSKIKGFLGDGYNVVASMGHIRALEEKLTSVGIDKDWEPTYVELDTKKDAIAKLRAAAKGAEEVILASDPDREGEGIAWHVCFILKLNPLTTKRIEFHEITRPAILAAVANPRRLDMNKVNAQQARAMLDLLVGFTISKVLWNRVAPKLSAGRCQTPALRLVVERDAEVDSHTSSAYWQLQAQLKPSTGSTLTLLEAQADKNLENETDATAVLHTVYPNPRVIVTDVKETVSISAAPKPLITSTLQQEASNTHGLSPKTTMQAAQKLYEAGHITYMRTDNPNLSIEAATAIREFITTTYGAEFVGAEGQHTIVPKTEVSDESATATTKPKGKKKKAADGAKGAAGGAGAVALPEAQAAHEAIRPTHPEVPEVATSDAAQQMVYKLIWKRAMQSQMAASQTDVRKVRLEFEADPGRVWNAEQTKQKFAGYRVLDRADVSGLDAIWDEWKPCLNAGAVLLWQTVNADEHFTRPKGRFTEASLIAELEKRGIGRPSTFASLVSVINDRNYVEKTNVEGKTQDSHHLSIKPNRWPPTASTKSHKVGAEKNKIRATALGKTVSDFLNKEYSDLFNYDFTAAMEADLDKIAQGTKPWKQLLQTTWDTYKERYTAQTAGGSLRRADRERELGPGLKIVLSTKGPLFVREPPVGSPKTVKASFAPVPPSVEFDSATVADLEKAFATVAELRAGELIGDLEGDEIRKKNGPYGWYVECKGARIPLRGEEDIEKIKERLKAKISFASAGASGAYERVVGEFTIRRGPYGLYFYKHKLKRAIFAGFPTGLDPDKVNAADLAGLYTDSLAKKRKFKGGAAKKGATGGAGATGAAE